MESIQELLKIRLEKFKENPTEALKTIHKEYQQQRSNGINFFVIEINKDRKKENLPELPYIAIRQKLIALREIEDLRWFYKECIKYSYTKDKTTGKRNTFSRCFFGALKI